MNARLTTDLIKAALLLHTIREDRSRLDLVLALQQHLIRQITRLERRSKRIKGAVASMREELKTKRPPKEQAKELKKRLSKSPVLLDKIRWEMFIWRCFGDGIAFVYQCKYSLKHLYFDRNYKIKETAGFLTGKTGFRLEWKAVRLGIKMEVPVVLADVTNVIRHGDICALAGPDPVIVEMKSGASRNERTDRQFSDINELNKFFENDGATSFRGMQNVKRQQMRHPEVNYLKEINFCITESRINGFSSIEPEPGLRYIATRNLAKAIPEQLKNYVSEYTACTGLTPEDSWLPSQPFTLSFDTANLIDFICGDVIVLVLIDLMAVKERFQEYGVNCVLLMDGVYSLQISKNSNNLNEGVFRVSDLLFARIATEFQSLAWFAKEYADSLYPKVIESLSLEELKKLPGIGRKAPADWYTAKDFFE